MSTERRRAGLDAAHASQRRAEPRRTALGGEHPGPRHQRRLVANVLIMPARELGDPVAVGILMKADDASCDARTYHTVPADTSSLISSASSGAENR